MSGPRIEGNLRAACAKRPLPDGQSVAKPQRLPAEAVEYQREGLRMRGAAARRLGQPAHRLAVWRDRKCPGGYLTGIPRNCPRLAARLNHDLPIGGNPRPIYDTDGVGLWLLTATNRGQPQPQYSHRRRPHNSKLNRCVRQSQSETVHGPRRISLQSSCRLSPIVIVTCCTQGGNIGIIM